MNLKCLIMIPLFLEKESQDKETRNTSSRKQAIDPSSVIVWSCTKQTVHTFKKEEKKTLEGQLHYFFLNSTFYMYTSSFQIYKRLPRSTGQLVLLDD